MTYKLAQLNLHDFHHSKKSGEVLIQPGSTVEESDLFIIIEIDSNTPADKQFIKEFLELAFETYEKTKIFEPERSLEKILHQLNSELPARLPQKNYLERLHCFVGLYHQGDLFFTNFRKINVYLIKPTGMKKINTQASEDEHKIFNYTFSGQLKNNDRVLITTESLTDYLSLEKIKKTVSALPPSSSIAHFTNLLQASPPDVSFFSIILTAPQIKEFDQETSISLTEKPAYPLTSKSSLDQLLKTQAKTDEILKKPSLLKSLKERVTTTITPKIEAGKPPAEKSIAKRTFKTAGARNLKNLSSTSLRGLISRRKVLDLFLKLKKIAQLLFFSETRQKTFSNFLTKLIRLYKKILSLSTANKFFLLIALVLLLLLSQNLIWQSQKRGRLINEQTYSEIIQQIQEKQHSIEASLIYNDTPRAKQLLYEINQLLSDFPQDSKERLAKYQELVTGTQQLSNKVWKVINIIEPTVLFDFKEINLGAQIFEIALKDNYLFGFNSTNQLFLYNLESSQKSVKSDFTYNLTNLALTPANLLIGQTPDKRFYSVNPTGFNEITVSAIDADAQIDDVAFFLDKMYLLDRKAKQIYRYTNYGDSFQAKRSWLNEELPLDQAVAITVDGYVYALLENGEVLKMGAGRKQDFPKIIIEPPLTSPTKLFTTAASNNLYILDPSNKRFLMVNKETGELVNQYYSEKFTNLKDFIVKEAENKVYLLNGSQVVVVGM